MIDSTRKKVIRVAAFSALLVLLAALLVVGLLVRREEDRSLDIFTDLIAKTGGRLTEKDIEPLLVEDGRANRILPSFFDNARYLDADTALGARFFLVHFSADGTPATENIENVSAVDAGGAVECALKAQASGAERGWVGDFRFKRFTENGLEHYVFLNGARTLELGTYFTIICMAAMVALQLALFLLLLIFSKKAVRPISEGYERQRRFITNVNHELKTPLTLILTNSEILQEETGGNEWLDGIREEAREMNRLINQLVDLSRLEENRSDTIGITEQVDLTALTGSALQELEPLFRARQLRLEKEMEPGVCVASDEALLRKLLLILLDNAAKYCDAGGLVRIVLKRERGAVLCVENSFADVDGTDLERLFERFYRGDSARTGREGHGVGLSIAWAVTERLGGKLEAYRAGAGVIGFRVTLRKA